MRAAGGLLAYLDTTQPGPSAAGAGSAALGLEIPPQQSDTPEQPTVPANNAVAGGSTGPGPIPLEMPTVWHAGDQLVLDAQTRRNLELTRTQLGGGLHGSLLWALDRTATAMGGRCLRRWIEAPLVEREAILVRQEAVGELVDHRPLRLALRRLLRPMGDLERLAGRAGAGSASARDLVALADGLERLPRLAGLLKDSHSEPLRALGQPWPDRRLERLAEDPAAWLGERLSGLRSRPDLRQIDLIDALWGDLEPKEALAQAPLHSQFEAEDLRDVLCGAAD
jgi:DNA mismatch repair protein MutS